MAEITQPTATEFTPDQLKYLEWVATPKALRTHKTVAAFAKSLKVDRTTLWRWSKLPGFREAVTDAARVYLKDELPAIFAALVERAVLGDVQAIKLALEVSGEFVPKRKIDLDVDVTKLSDEELERLITDQS